MAASKPASTPTGAQLERKGKKALRSELADAKRQLRAEQGMWARTRSHVLEIAAQATRANQRLGQLVEALIGAKDALTDFGAHDKDCPGLDGTPLDPRCECGLLGIINGIEEEINRPSEPTSEQQPSKNESDVQALPQAPTLVEEQPGESSPTTEGCAFDGGEAL